MVNVYLSIANLLNTDHELGYWSTSGMVMMMVGLVQDPDRHGYQTG